MFLIKIGVLITIDEYRPIEEASGSSVFPAFQMLQQGFKLDVVNKLLDPVFEQYAKNVLLPSRLKVWDNLLT